MRGYQCDNCRDFTPEETSADDSVFRRHNGQPPKHWIAMFSQQLGEHPLHFCSEACAYSYTERLAQAWG